MDNKYCGLAESAGADANSWVLDFAQTGGLVAKARESEKIHLFQFSFPIHVCCSC
jgi:hypothetical protein